VVVPRKGGAPFDSLTPDAFERVTRAEDATRRLSQIGPERVALWFAALGGGRCPMPASDEAHFTEVERLGEGQGVRIAFPVGMTASAERRCVIELGTDGTLGTQRVTEKTRTGPASRWAKDS
jgi:hypothetical protein